LLASCTSWEHVHDDANLSQVFQLGDLARVEQQDGTKVQFAVAEVGPSHLAGEGHTFEQNKVVAIEVEEIDGLKTVGAVAGSVGMIYVVAGAIVFVALLGAL